jgi:hypothetical protein
MNEKVYERIETNSKTFERVDPDVVAAALGAERVDGALAERGKVQVRVLRMMADREAPADGYAAELDALQDVPEVTWKELGEMATLMRESADTIESLLASAPSAPQPTIDAEHEFGSGWLSAFDYADLPYPPGEALKSAYAAYVHAFKPASQEEPTQANSLPCRWHEDVESGSWDTDCGHRFEFIDDGPAENGQRFCGYCGRALEPVRGGKR